MAMPFRKAHPFRLGFAPQAFDFKILATLSEQGAQPGRNSEQTERHSHSSQQAAKPMRATT